MVGDKAREKFLKANSELDTDKLLNYLNINEHDLMDICFLNGALHEQKSDVLIERLRPTFYVLDKLSAKYNDEQIKDFFWSDSDEDGKYVRLNIDLLIYGELQTLINNVEDILK